jgi:Ca2+-binding EF-hand superfamily protein
MQSLDNLFKKYDVNNLGRLSYSDWFKIFKEFEIELNDDQIFVFIYSIDTDKNGTIEYRYC